MARTLVVRLRLHPDKHHVPLFFRISSRSNLPTSPKMKSGQVPTIPAPTAAGRRARRGKARPSRGLEGLVIRAGEGRCRPRGSALYRGCSAFECSIESGIAPVRGRHSRCCRRSFAESSTRHMRRGRRLGLVDRKSPSARLATGRAPVRGPSRASLGGQIRSSFGRGQRKGTNDAQRTGEGDAPGALAAAISQAAVQIAEPGDDAHPRLEMPSPLALFGGLGSRLSLVAHMTEQGPGRWDEGEFPDAPSLLSPKTTHRKITPRFPTSCLSRF